MPTDPHTAPVDYVLMAGKKSPGIATVTGVTAPRKWDARQGYGLSGSFPFFFGMDLAKPVLKIRLISAEDWQAWHEWKSVVAPPRPGRRDTKVTIWHPYLEDAGIAEVVILDVQGPEQDDATGSWTFTIPLMQYRRPKAHLEKPSTPKDEPLTPNQQEIRDKREELERLAAS